MLLFRVFVLIFFFPLTHPVSSLPTHTHTRFAATAEFVPYCRNNVDQRLNSSKYAKRGGQRPAAGRRTSSRPVRCPFPGPPPPQRPFVGHAAVAGRPDTTARSRLLVSRMYVRVLRSPDRFVRQEVCYTCHDL